MLKGKGKFVFSPFKNGTIYATGFMLVFSVLLLIASPVQRFCLKSNRSIKDIRLSMYFLLLIMGILFLSDLVFGTFPVAIT